MNPAKLEDLWLVVLWIDKTSFYKVSPFASVTEIRDWSTLTLDFNKVIPLPSDNDDASRREKDWGARQNALIGGAFYYSGPYGHGVSGLPCVWFVSDGMPSLVLSRLRQLLNVPFYCAYANFGRPKRQFADYEHLTQSTPPLPRITDDDGDLFKFIADSLISRALIGQPSKTNIYDIKRKEAK